MATYDLRDAIAEIQEDIGALSGMREAPTDAREQPHVFPFAMCMPYEGEWTAMDASFKKGLQTVTLDIHVAGKDLPRDLKALSAYEETVPNALCKNPTLDGTVDTIVMPIRWRFMTFDWGDGVMTRGYRFFIAVKMCSAIT